ncbi:hypothetical protein KHP62_04650 [Rhodobacteraceae bacterium NNCM2]|nr:hypothetical protein [Coraliihabitans acroporae]
MEKPEGKIMLGVSITPTMRMRLDGIVEERSTTLSAFVRDVLEEKLAELGK